MTNPHKSWRRLTLSVLGIAIVAANWRWAVAHLYTLPEHSIAVFASITNNAAYVIGAIVIFMVTGTLVYDWRNRTMSSIGAMFSKCASDETERQIVTRSDFYGDEDNQNEQG